MIESTINMMGGQFMPVIQVTQQDQKPKDAVREAWDAGYKGVMHVGNILYMFRPTPEHRKMVRRGGMSWREWNSKAKMLSTIKVWFP